MSKNNRAIFKEKSITVLENRANEMCFKRWHLLDNIDFSDASLKKTNIRYMSMLVKHFMDSIMTFYLSHIAYLLLAS